MRKSICSPTPWAFDYDKRNDRFNMRSETDGSFGHFCGWSADGVTTEEQDKAHIEHIVKCVNAHDELVAALRGLIACRNRHETPQGSHWQNARRALAKLEGGAK